MATYTSVEECSQTMGLPNHSWDVLTANSGVSNPVGERARIYVGTTAIMKYPIGAKVRIAERDVSGALITRFCEATVLTHTPGNTYFSVAADLVEDYHIADNAAVQLLTPFDSFSKPRYEDLVRIIEEIEDTIDNKTHHTWRQRVQEEYKAFFPNYVHYTYPMSYTSGTWREKSSFWKVLLQRRNIKPLSATADTAYTGYPGDSLLCWDGNRWVEWLNVAVPYGGTYVAHVEGRDKDWWMDYQNGEFFFVGDRPGKSDISMRIHYRYGDTLNLTSGTPATYLDAPADRDIMRACRLLVQAEMLMLERFQVNFPGGDESGAIPPRAASHDMRDEAHSILMRHTEIIGYFGDL